MTTKYIRDCKHLTYEGATLAVQAAVAKARRSVFRRTSPSSTPAAICSRLPEWTVRVFLPSTHPYQKRNAAPLAYATGHLPPQFGLDLALATGGRSINMVGGLPIVVDGYSLGAVGVMSGEPEQAVAEAARDAVFKALERLESECALCRTVPKLV